MTLVFGSGNGGSLQQMQWGINELASAFVIGKSIGSVFSRDTDATIFQIIEDQFGVRVNRIPEWFEGFRFPRRGTVHGRESVDRITSILEQVIERGPTSVLYHGRLGDHATRMAYSMKELLSNFVRATIDSDADSEQAANVLKWMAQFAMDVGISMRRRLSVGRVQDHNLKLITKLLSDTRGINEAGSEGDNLSRESGRLVYDTISIGAVSIALAARANGAKITLQCVTVKGTKDIPDWLDESLFVVRLWLRQPPPNISNISSQWDKAEFDTGRSEAHGRDGISHSVIFGGRLEVAYTVAGEIAVEFPNAPFEDNRERVEDMWSKGVEVGRSLQWMVWPPRGTDARPGQIRPVRFGLNVSDCFKDVPPQVDRLAVSFSKYDARLNALSRVIANIVHDVFHYTDYSQDGCPDFAAALTFVTVAIAVGCLHTITKAEAGHDDSYALDLAAGLAMKICYGQELPCGVERLLERMAMLWLTNE
ncbi:hypothetical protein DL765_006987 [Monosporascus sp. GIB2]|nr:hypothetical protein DL765_006987 [Monosporascus sp. GIB2]